MTTATTLIDQALAGRHLLTHPFYERWEAGELREGELARYAEQYRHVEAYLPEYLAELAAALPSGVARDAVADNLADEVGPPSHVALFDEFAHGVGAGAASPTTATRDLLQAYEAVLAAGPVEGLAGLLAYEVQGADIARSKASGLRAHYGATPATCAFWDAHAAVEGTHAQWTLSALDVVLGDVGSATASARRIADAWWSFLDERELAHA